MCVAEKLRALLPDDISPDTIFAISPPTFSDILTETAALYQFTPDKVIYNPARAERRGRCRRRTLRSYRNCGKRELMVPRMIVCALARQLTKLSFSQIADRLGYSDHTTVYNNACRIAERLAAGDEILLDDLDILKRRILDRVLDRFGGTECH